MIAAIKRSLRMHTPLGMAAAELVEAERLLLECQTAREYAEAMVAYNRQRVFRLRNTIREMSADQIEVKP